MFSILKNNDIIILVARILLGAIYAAAIVNLLQGQVPTEYAEKGAKFISLPAVLVWIGYIVKVLAGICLIIGFQSSIAALSLVIFTLITAFNYHDLGGATFMKEMCMVGGLLLISTSGPGRISVDYRLS